MESTSAETPVFAAAAECAECVERAQRKERTERHAAARVNPLLIALACAALVYELAALPLLLRAPHVALLALTLFPVVLVTPIHWGLVHEGIHGQLFRARGANERVARALAIGLALPFDA